MNTKQKIGTVLPLLKADVNVITSTIMQMEKIYNNKRVTMKKLLKKNYYVYHFFGIVFMRFVTKCDNGCQRE